MRILITVNFILLSFAAFAQGRGYFYENTERTFYGGAVAGMNFSTVDGDGYGGYHKVGLNAGGIVYGRLLRRLLASVELLYSQKGSRGVKVYDSYYSGTFTEKYYLDLNYVEIPVVLNFLINDKWNVGVGGAYAQLINSKEEAYTDQPVSIKPDINVFRKTDYSFVLSGGMQLYKGFFVSFRYQNSLSTIRDADKIPIGFGGGTQTNNLFSLRLMYLLN